MKVVYNVTYDDELVFRVERDYGRVSKLPEVPNTMIPFSQYEMGCYLTGKITFSPLNPRMYRPSIDACRYQYIKTFDFLMHKCDYTTKECNITNCPLLSGHPSFEDL